MFRKVKCPKCGREKEVIADPPTFITFVDRVEVEVSTNQDMDKIGCFDCFVRGKK